jgi:hypothetical protein
MQVAADLSSDREFLGIFDDWRDRVAAQAAKKQSKPASPAAAATGSLPSTESSEDDARLRTRKELRTVLESRFSEDDLKTLCFDLGRDYEEFAGGSKPARVIAIISYFERVQRTEDLKRAMRDMRPFDKP